MEQLMTPDGLYAISDSQKDISELCRKYISEDVARYVYEVLGDVGLEQEEYVANLESEVEEWESESEYWRDELWEINSQLQQLSVQADEPGFSKKKIVAKIDEMWQHLQKIL